MQFSTVAEETKTKVKQANKSFDKFLQHADEKSFYLKPTTPDEI